MTRTEEGRKKWDRWSKKKEKSSRKEWGATEEEVTEEEGTEEEEETEEETDEEKTDEGETEEEIRRRRSK